MKKADAIEHFGSVRKLAHALDMSTAAIYSWGKYVPLKAAQKIKKLSGNTVQINYDGIDDDNNNDK